MADDDFMLPSDADQTSTFALPSDSTSSTPPSSDNFVLPSDSDTAPHDYGSILSIPSTQRELATEGMHQMGRGVSQLGSGEPWEMAKGAGNVALGGMGYVGSWPNAALREIVGKPISGVAEKAGAGSYAPLIGSVAEIGAGFGLPVPKGMPRSAALPAEDATFGLPLTAGEAAQNPGMVRAEQQAIRQGKDYATGFAADRAGRLENISDRIASGFDQFGANVASTPQEAGALHISRCADYRRFSQGRR